MSIFNSLGSNYNFSYILKSFFANTSETDMYNLNRFLSKKYGGETILFYKGREAITAAIETMEFSKNDQIIINGFTCLAVIDAIKKSGLEPFCLDLDENGGLNFTAKMLKEQLSKNKKIKAVMIQNTLGFPCEMKEIEEICKKNKLVLVEDLAHSIGTIYEDGREAGTVGDFVILSFSQDKIIDAVSGGALIIRNKRFQNLKKITHFQQPKNQFKDRLYPIFTYKIRKTYSLGVGKIYHFLLKRFHLMSNIMDKSFYEYFALPSWNARIAFLEFGKLDEQLSHRRSIAKIYTEILPDTVFMWDLLRTKKAVELSSNLRFPIFIQNRAKILSKLKKQNINLSDIWYSDVDKGCYNAVNDSQIILNLPTHINISQNQARRIAKIINTSL